MSELMIDLARSPNPTISALVESGHLWRAVIDRRMIARQPGRLCLHLDLLCRLSLSLGEAIAAAPPLPPEAMPDEPMVIAIYAFGIPLSRLPYPNPGADDRGGRPTKPS